MQLKKYQSDVLVQVQQYLALLQRRRSEAQEFAEFRRSRGEKVAVQPFCATAWADLAAAGKMPRVENTIPPWIGRTDPLGREVPHICMKVPTGGGKTLLACHALGMVASEYLGKRAGLVAWVVPSDAILRQTAFRLCNRADPYRIALDIASGGRVRILQKGDAFTANDVAENLCILLVMLQSTVRTDTEALKVFRDAAGFSSFFPPPDNDPANRELAKLIPNLDRIDHTADGIPGITVRQSLANVLRLLRPILVIDEGHRAYTDLARDSLLNLNPEFLLELTATPNSTGHRSNILVSVPGTALKSEEMIKLPINVFNLESQPWQGAVRRGLELLNDLEKDATKQRRRDGRQVRPIMLVRVEATGPRQRNTGRIHSDDVRDYLVSKLRVQEDWIRIKTASLDELGDDDLMLPECSVRVILTKDALREGWDCPFAYVLVVLSNTTAYTAITQMVGRVLRQPNGKRLSIQPLNECYVVCTNQEVKEAVRAVQAGLASEGMLDISGEIRLKGKEVANRVLVKKNPKTHPKEFLLPVVGIKTGAGQWRAYDPERDLLPRINWDALHFRKRDAFAVTSRAQQTALAISIEDVSGNLALSVDANSSEIAPRALPGIAPGVSQLFDMVPNAWQAARILRDAESALLKRGISFEQLALSRPLLAEAVRQDVQEQVDSVAEAEFRAMLASGQIALLSQREGNVGVSLPDEFWVSTEDPNDAVTRKNGSPLRKNSFQILHESSVNSLEKDVIRRLDATPDVTWWYRVPVQQDWALLGWRKNRIFPDVSALVETRNGPKLAIIESKGSHLIGNADTTYKRDVLNLLANSFISDRGRRGPIACIAAILTEPHWEAELAAALSLITA